MVPRALVAGAGRRGVALALIGSAAAAGSPAHAASAAPPERPAVTDPLQTVAADDFRSFVITREAPAVAAPPAVVWPLGPDADISDFFGPRSAPAPGASTFHRGIDLVAPEGTVVAASLAGTVIAADARGTGACGVFAEIAHRHDGASVVTKYCHLQSGSLAVAEGQEVRAGDIVGALGNTGVSTGPHLHFELAVDGRHVDPLPWLAARAGR